MASRRRSKSTGRHRSKSDSTADSVIGLLVLIVLGWVILHWREVLFALALVAVAVCIYLVLKQGVKNSLDDHNKSHTNSQGIEQHSVLPTRRLSKWEINQLDDVALNELIEAGRGELGKLSQQIERQRFHSLPVIDTNPMRQEYGLPPRETATSVPLPEVTAVKQTAEGDAERIPLNLTIMQILVKRTEKKEAELEAQRQDALEAELQKLEAFIKSEFTGVGSPGKLAASGLLRKQSQQQSL